MAIPFAIPRGFRFSRWLGVVVLWLSAIGIASSPFFVDVEVAAHVDHQAFVNIAKIKIPSDLADSVRLINGRDAIEYMYQPRDFGSLDGRFEEIRLLAPADRSFQRAVDSLHAQLITGFRLCWAWLAIVLILEVSAVLQSRRSAIRAGETVGAIWLERFFDYRASGILAVLLISFIYFLARNSMMSFGSPIDEPGDGGFWHAHGEFFVTLGFIIAVIGTWFALFAKRRADAVFEMSSLIHQNLTAFFSDYDSVVDDTRERSVPKLIEKARKSLTFFMGPPIMGYFRDPTRGVHIQGLITGKVTQKPSDKFKVSYICWGDERCKPYVDKLNANDKILFEHARQLLFSTIRGAGGTVDHYEHNQDPMIRFVVADEAEAIFWVIDDYTPEGVDRDREKKRDYGSYPGGGFTTDNASMIRLLMNIFKNVSREGTASPPGKTE